MAHAPVNFPAVSFKLSFTRASGADAAAQLRHLNSPPGESRQHVFQLRQFDLQLSFAGSGVLGEDVEDKLRAVDHADIDYLFDIALLRGGEVVIKQNQIGGNGGYRSCNFRQLSACRSASPGQDGHGAARIRRQFRRPHWWRESCSSSSDSSAVNSGTFVGGGELRTALSRAACAPLGIALLVDLLRRR